MNDVEIIYDESGLTALWACQNLGDYSPLSGDFSLSLSGAREK